MRIGLQTWGSTGDVRPFLALAAGLTAAGHAVHLCVTDLERGDYSRFAAGAGFRLTRIAMDAPADGEHLDRLGERILAARDPFSQARIIFQTLFAPSLPAMSAAAVALCADSDLVVRHHVLHCTQSAADAVGCPEISVFLAHSLVPTRHLRPADFPPLGQPGNAFAWWLARRLLNRMLLREINALRENHGLAGHRDVIEDAWLSRRLNLLAVSPALVRRPPDWPVNLEACGFLVPTAAAPAPGGALAAFLAAGPPPLFFTIGSMLPKTAHKRRLLFDQVIAAARACGCRAVLQAHPDDLATFDQAADVHFTATVDHAALMPRAALIVHHGGAGTTHSALRAGVPQLVIAHVADQFFWGSEMVRLGVAPTRLRARTLSGRQLARAVRAGLTRPALRKRATELAACLRADDGIGRAVAAIERALAGRAAPATGPWPR